MSCGALLSVLITIIVGIAQAHIVEIENGKIVGAEYENFFAYRGIRYGKAERFALAKPTSEKWNDTREFFNYADDCAQYDHLTYSFIGKEDCLSLNVFVPKSVVRSNEPVPVVFFIHGGAFMFGSTSHYHPEFIMNHGKMILVTVNYRLGILGFMSLEDSEVLPGNLGLKDQNLALKWVKRNIRAFNGDPEKVTITGYSAGGASVQLHYLSELSHGLFNNGISHSGVSFNPWVLAENSRKKAYKIAEYSDCPLDDDRDMIKCLKKKPVKHIVMLARKFQPFKYNPFSPFGVVIEKSHKTAFITEQPQVLLERGEFYKRPWLLSLTKDEGNYPASEFYGDEKILKEIDEKWETLAPAILDFDQLTPDSAKKREVSKIIRQFYMHKMPISRENYQAFDDIISDRLFRFNAFQAIQLSSKHVPSYFYYFRYKSVSGVAEFLSKTKDNLGISHGEDVFLIFKAPFRDVPYSGEELEMSQNLIEMYYQFATQDSPKFGDFKVKPSQPEKIQFLQIFSNEKSSMKEIDDSFGNVEFWEKMQSLLVHSSEKHAADEL